MRYGGSEFLFEAVPNISTVDASVLAGMSQVVRTRSAVLLDIHSDPDHGRSVLTLVAGPQQLSDAISAIAAIACDEVDMTRYAGAHPAVGSLDVVPVVYLSSDARDAAVDEALGIGNRLAASFELPVFLYGELATSEQRRERAFFRSGGLVALGARMRGDGLAPDFGPQHPHPTAGATLVTARPPLVAFNVELERAGIDGAKRIAARLREAGGGLPGVRALGLELESRGAIQVSMNIHDPFEVPLARVVDEVERLATGEGAQLSAAELVGLVPRAALNGLDTTLLRDFNPAAHILEDRIPADGATT